MNHTKAIGPARKIFRRQPSLGRYQLRITQKNSDEGSLCGDGDDENEFSCDDDDNSDNESSKSNRSRSRYSSCSREKPESWEGKFRLLVQYKNNHWATREGPPENQADDNMVAFGIFYVVVK